MISLPKDVVCHVEMDLLRLVRYERMHLNCITEAYRTKLRVGYYGPPPQKENAAEALLIDMPPCARLNLYPTARPSTPVWRTAVFADDALQPEPVGRWQTVDVLRRQYGLGSEYARTREAASFV